MKTLKRDLQRLIEGEVFFDELTRTIYSSAASIYRVKPFGIVIPKHQTDVIRLVRFAAEKGIPLIPRGGGTSRTGNELGEGILVDFTKYMNRILEFEPKEEWVRVQPGMILDSLNKFLKPHKLSFPSIPRQKNIVHWVE